ncbi:glutamate 5-kinase, partial [Klebsiella pneumoniae subsp. ozaenae]
APDPVTGELQRYEVITASADSAGAAYSIQLRRA